MEIRLLTVYGVSRVPDGRGIFVIVAETPKAVTILSPYSGHDWKMNLMNYNDQKRPGTMLYPINDTGEQFDLAVRPESMTHP